MDSSCDSVGIDVPESLLSRQKEEPIMSNDTRIAIDVAKAVFELAISDRPGHVARRVRLPRAQFLPFMAQQPAATAVMEACGSAHYWAREIQTPATAWCRFRRTTSVPTFAATTQTPPTPRASARPA